MIIIAAILASFPGMALGQRPYVQPVTPESGTTSLLAVHIERATEWDIYFSSGYEQARILGTEVFFEGSVTNTSGSPYGNVRITFTARDIFGRALAGCSSGASPSELPPGGSGSFRCDVKVPVADYLNRFTYSVTGQRR